MLYGNNLLKKIFAEAENFLTLFLGFGGFSGWFSYKCFSVLFMYTRHNIFLAVIFLIQFKWIQDRKYLTIHYICWLILNIHWKHVQKGTPSFFGTQNSYFFFRNVDPWETVTYHPKMSSTRNKNLRNRRISTNYLDPRILFFKIIYSTCLAHIEQIFSNFYLF